MQRSIGYYQSLHKDANLTRLIGLGGSFHLPGLRKYLKQQLGMEVYRLEEWKRPVLTDLGEEKAEAYQKASMEMATAYGLALQGVGLQTIDANLIPTAVVREGLWRKKVKWFGMAAGVGLAAAGAMFVRPVLDQQAISAAERDTETQNVIRQAVNMSQRLRSEAEQARTTGQAQVDPRASRVASLLEGRDMFTYLLADVGTMLEDAERVRPEFVRSVGVTSQPEGPGWVVTSLTTRYEPDAFFRSGQMAGGVRVGGNDNPAASDPHPDKPRIIVTIQVTTRMPNYERFFLATLARWMEDNAQRPGLPYRIHAERWRADGRSSTRRSGPGSPPRARKRPHGQPTGGRARPAAIRGELRPSLFMNPATMTQEQIAEANASGRSAATSRSRRRAHPCPTRDAARRISTASHRSRRPPSTTISISHLHDPLVHDLRPGRGPAGAQEGGL